MVEVCAIVYSPNITCPIEFAFDVNLSTNDNTAGNIAIFTPRLRRGRVIGPVCVYVCVCLSATKNFENSHKSHLGKNMA